MKKKSKKLMGITGAGILLISGAATGGAYIMSSQGEPRIEVSSSSEKLPIEEQETLVNGVVSMVESGFRPTEIEPKIRENIEKLDKENATRLVREFVDSMNQTSNYFGQLLYFMATEIEYTYTVDDITYPVKNKENLSNEFVKGFLKEAERQHLTLKPMNGYYFVEPDAKYVLDKYGAYVHGDYKDFLNLMAKQSTDPIFDEEKQTYDVSRLKEDLEAIELSRDRWMDGDYKNDFQEMELMLYEAMFGVSHATFYDVTIENEGEENEEFIYTLKEDILEQFESLILENSETTLSKEMQEFLNVLEANNGVLNDKVDTFLAELFTEKFNLTTSSVPSEASEPVSEEGSEK